MKKQVRCVIPRIAKNPKAIFRWFRLYTRKVRMTESELGGKIHPC